jgi:serine/threonine protein kinase
MSEEPNPEVAILNASLELTPAERPAYLDQACAGDPSLRRRVEELLRAHEQAEGFMESPPAGLDFQRPESLHLPVLEKPGDKIGRYKLLQQIGEGGCGVVYMAEQEEPVKRRVALKILKLGMDTKQVIARFDAERQALALMDHPNIAKVLDAGATDTGRPYFVMELVRGIKITEFCDQNNLTIRERLDLFVLVCRAIQHAHQKGIIHRDVKPSNILVTENDGVPVPKVIDFGIAKATQGRLTDQTLFTAFEQFIGTPAYMSPEQAVMTSLDIDTRSDIYSLGVLLYELLTGKTPFDQKELLAAGLDAMRRTIREVEPVKPSTRFTQEELAQSAALDKSAIRPAAPKRSEGGNPKSAIDRDLDWIVMKALEKDRTRRYETANGLARDVQRYLDNEPITARPPSRLYRFQKLVRRNKLAFASASAVAAALVIGLGVATWMFFKEKAARERAVTAEKEQIRLRDEAQTEAAKSWQVAQFLKDMLSGVNPWVAEGRDTTLLREILDNTAQRIERDLKDQPKVEAELLDIIGRAYFETGPPGKAEALLGKGLAIARSLPGDNRALIAQLLHDSAVLFGRETRFPEAETALRESITILRTLSGEWANQSLMHSHSVLGWVLLSEGKLSEAEAAEREALRLARKPDGSEDVSATEHLRFLGQILDAQGKLDEAEATHRRAIAICRNLGATNTYHYAGVLRFLGDTLMHEKKLVEAEAVYREALAVHRKFSDQQRSSELAWDLTSLAELLNQQGNYAEAEDAFRHVWLIQKKVLGEDHPYTLRTRSQLIAVLQKAGKTNEAKALLESRTNTVTEKESEPH